MQDYAILVVTPLQTRGLYGRTWARSLLTGPVSGLELIDTNEPVCYLIGPEILPVAVVESTYSQQ